jgi:hypothetical protein
VDVQLGAGRQRAEGERSRGKDVVLHDTGLALDRVVYGMMSAVRGASLFGKFCEERATVNECERCGRC